MEKKHLQKFKIGSDSPLETRALESSTETVPVAVFFANPISNAIMRTPTRPTRLNKDSYKKIFNGEEGEKVCELDVKCIKRGNVQLSLFEEQNEIHLSDNSKKIFVVLLQKLYEYYRQHGRDVEGLILNTDHLAIIPSEIAPFVSKGLSENVKERKGQLNNIQKSIKNFTNEINEIKIIAHYTYWKNKKKYSLEFEGGVFDNTKITLKSDSWKEPKEFYRINPDFYYSLVNCLHIMQIPFTAFAVTGKNAFSLIFDLYAKSRESGGKRVFSVKGILEHLGLDNRIKGPAFRRQTLEPINNILKASVIVRALKSYKFILNGKEIDPKTCSNSDWTNSDLVWEQAIPSETPTLIENKERIHKRIETRTKKYEAIKMKKKADRELASEGLPPTPNS